MQKKDPPIFVTRPSLPPAEDYETLVREIFESGYLIFDPYSTCLYTSFSVISR